MEREKATTALSTLKVNALEIWKCQSTLGISWALINDITNRWPHWKAKLRKGLKDIKKKYENKKA